MPSEAILYLTENIDTAYQHSLEQIAEIKRVDILSPITLLLPRRREIDTYRNRLPNALNVSMFEFIGLARQVIRDANSPIFEIQGSTVHKIIFNLLAEMEECGGLSSFTEVWNKPGFINELLNWLRDTRSQQISPSAYQEYAATSQNPHDKQLAAIYMKYLEVLSVHGYADREEMQRQAINALAEDSNILRGNENLFVLGFDHFSPLQITFLRLITGNHKKVNLYLPWDPDRDKNNIALSRLLHTKNALQEAISVEEIILDSVDTKRSISLRFLQKHLFTGENEIPPEVLVGDIRLVAAPSREEEIRYCLRESKKLLSDNVPAGDIKILAPHPELYLSLIRAVSYEYQIPIEFNEHLLNNPAIIAFLNCISLYPDFPWRSTIEVLRSPYIQQQWLNLDQIDLVERYSRKKPVIGGINQWEFALSSPIEELRDKRESHFHKDNLENDDSVEELEAVLDGLLSFFEHISPADKNTLKGYTWWLQSKILGVFPERVLNDQEGTDNMSLDLVDCCQQSATAEHDLTAIQGLLKILRELIIPDKISDAEGEAQIEWDVFLAELQGLIMSSTVQTGTNKERVLFNTLEAGRSQPVEHLFIIGLSEGEFPTPITTDPFYSTQERENHPLPILKPKSNDNASLWWQVISNCQEQLTLIRPYLDSNGATWSTSAYWDEVKKCFSNLNETRIPIGHHPGIEDAASLAELLTVLSLNRADTIPPELEGHWQRASYASKISELRNNPGAVSNFEGYLKEGEVLEALRMSYGSEHVWSPSRLNSYNNCPYGFFAESVLKIESQPDPEEGIDHLLRGTILHNILEKYYSTLVMEKIIPTISNTERCLVILDSVEDNILAEAPIEHNFQPGILWEYEKKQIKRQLAAFVAWECNENGEEPLYSTYSVEVSFGWSGSQIPSVTIGDGEERIKLRGVIDRIDQDTNGNLRVIDYKSGSSSISKKAISDGTALQSALYAHAASYLTQRGTRVSQSYYLHLPNRKVSGEISFKGSVSENRLIQAAEEAVNNAVTHIRNGEFPSIPAKSYRGGTACRDFCEFSGLCRVSRLSIHKAKARGF